MVMNDNYRNLALVWRKHVNLDWYFLRRLSIIATASI